MPERPSDKSQFVADTLGEPIDVLRHDTPERHTFGDALLIPDDADIQPTGTIAFAGLSPKVARADHVHPGGGGSGVTDHGALTGLADDDHPQYLLPTEVVAGAGITATPSGGTVTVVNADSGSTAVAAHAAAADPHAVYLRIAEILAGANLVVTDNGNGTVTIGAPNVPPTSRLINTTAPLTGGGSLAADRTLAITNFAGAVPGAVPTSAGGTANFLRADGTWAAPAGGGSGTSMSGQWLWVATSQTTDPGSQNVAANVANALTATVIQISKTLANSGTATWPAKLKANDQLIIAVVTGTAQMRYTVTGDPTDNGTYWSIPVANQSGISGQVEPNHGVLIDVTGVATGGGGGGGVTAHSALTGLTAPADDHTQYVKKAGDTMTGVLILNSRLDIKDPVAGATGYATQRMYHDNNTDHIALSINPTTPGLEVFDSRDAASVLMRIARGERVKFPTNGHEHKYHCSVQIAGATPLTSWTQMPFGTVYETSGNMTIQSNPGGVLVPEIGYYMVNVLAVSDRALASLQMSLKWNANTMAFQSYPSGIPNRFGAVSVFYVPVATTWITTEAYTPTACWLGGDANLESKITVVSLF